MVPRRRTECLLVRLAVTSKAVLMERKALTQGPMVHTLPTPTSRPAPHTTPHTTTGAPATLLVFSMTKPTVVQRTLIPHTRTLDPTSMWQVMVRVLSNSQRLLFNAARQPNANPPRNWNLRRKARQLSP